MLCTPPCEAIPGGDRSRQFRQIIDLARRAPSAGLSLEDVEEAADALPCWPAPTLPGVAVRPAAARAGRIVGELIEQEFREGARDVLRAVAPAFRAEANSDPITAARRAMERHHRIADPADVAECFGLIWADGFLETVQRAAASGEAKWIALADEEETALRFELDGHARLVASRAASDILRDLPEDEDFVDALLATHPLVTRDMATDVAKRTIRRLAEPPLRQYFPDPVDPWASHWEEPGEAASSLHEKAKTALEHMLQEAASSDLEDVTHETPADRLERPGVAESKAIETPAPRHDRATGVLDLRRRLRAVDFDPSLEFQPPSWLVKGVMPRQGLGLIYGASGAGKTFLAIHAALSVAWGLPFFGNRTKRGGVLYVAAEGGASVLPRIRAANDAMGGAVAAARLSGEMPQRAPIRIVTEAPNLSRDGDARPLAATIADAAAEFAEAGHELALVVIDTWHAAMGGADENSAADAGAALAPLREAAERHGTFVAIIHHPGKDSERGARGSNALPAAVDATIALTVLGFEGAVARPASAMRRATVTKLRDGEVGGDFSYRLPIVTLGTDEDGDPWTTCVVEPCPTPVLDDDGLSKTDRELIDVVRAAVSEAGGGRVTVKELRLRFYAGRPDAKPDARRVAFGRALSAAIRDGRIKVDDAEEWAWTE